MPRGKPNEKIKLTKRSVESLAAENARGERFYDTLIKGFGVVVYPSGRKKFFLDYGPKRRRRRATLGEFGPMTVAKARSTALRTLSELTEGADPLERREAARRGYTFGEWKDVYLPTLEGRKKATSIDMDRLYLGRAAERWKNVPLTEITVEAVQRFYDAQKDRGRCTANRSLASLRTCLAAAWRMDLVPENVAMKVKPLPEPLPRTRTLDSEELGRLTEAIASVQDDHVRCAFVLLLETGARRGEVLNMRWVDLDLHDVDRATWYLPNPKRRRPETKPLTRGAAEMLRSLPRKGEYVIAGRYPDRPRSDLKKHWDRIRKEAELEGVRMHDIRRTFGLEVARRAGLHIASRLLGHSSVRITERVYAPLGIDELREAAERVNRERLAKVIPLRPDGETKGADQR